MHLQRLSRFQEGTVNPKALDNLNWLLLSLFILKNIPIKTKAIKLK